MRNSLENKMVSLRQTITVVKFSNYDFVNDKLERSIQKFKFLTWSGKKVHDILNVQVSYKSSGLDYDKSEGTKPIIKSIVSDNAKANTHEQVNKKMKSYDSHVEFTTPETNHVLFKDETNTLTTRINTNLLKNWKGTRLN